MKRRFAILTLVFFPILGSCQKAEEKTAVKPEGAQSAKVEKVRFKTSKGDFVVELNHEKAPISVANFISYVNKKHYDGTVFHRVMDGFMIQGGGFALENGKLVEKKSDAPIKNEGKNGLKNLRGTIAMARTPDPDSATAQFYVNVADNSSLDGGYAVFGKVVEGMDVVDKIKSVATGNAVVSMRHPATGQSMDAPSQNVPTEPVVIKSATAE